MKKYQFEYTSQRNSLLIILACILSLFITPFLGLTLFKESGKQLALPLTIVSMLVPFVVFRILKNKAVYNCTAMLDKDSVRFEFKDEVVREINFNELISYKVYYSKNGPILYLKNNIDNFKLFANVNFCKVAAFSSFCQDLISQLDNYRNTQNSGLIHEGSFFGTKGMLYFSMAATFAYLVSVLIAPQPVRIVIGIAGG